MTDAHAATRSGRKAETTTVELETRAAPWEIEAGHTVQGYTFNGQVPGPTIEGRTGEEIVIRLKNSLPEPTVIHWHGLRVPADMDGTDLAQQPVEPGETFEYRFTPPECRHLLVPFPRQRNRAGRARPIRRLHRARRLRART
jgi:FtsP/CotA-like multicopper oxidase with cupredoxin domain